MHHPGAWLMMCAAILAAMGVGCSSAPPPVPDAPSPATNLYLGPDEAMGGRYCLNPDSAALRELLTQPPVAADAPLERRALAADVVFLRDALRKLYSGWPELVQHRAFDVNAFFDQWHDEVLAGPETVDFQSGVVDRLVVMKRALADLHLQPAGWGRKLRERGGLGITEYIGDGRVVDPGACTVAGGLDVQRHTLRNARRLDASGKKHDVVAVSVRGQGLPGLLELRCGASRLTLTKRKPLAPHASAEEAPLYAFSAHGDTAVIVVRRLWGDAEQLRQLEQLAEDYAAHRTFKTLVFDFRGNGGGSDGYIYSWIDRAKRGAWSMRPSVKIAGGLAPCEGWNQMVSFQIKTGLVDEPKAIQEREMERASWPAYIPPVRHHVFTGQRRSDAQEPYNGHIVVLVDRQSASSGESGPEALKAALGAVLVGERTAGYLEYGNLRTVVLPHTGVVMRVPSKRNYYDPPAEGVGLAVDLYLEEEALGRPAEELLPMLKRQQTPGRYHMVP